MRGALFQEVFCARRRRCLPLRRSFQENSFSFNLTQTFLSKNLMQSWGCRKANRFWLLLNWKPLQNSFIHHSDMKEYFSMNISKPSKIRKMRPRILFGMIIDCLSGDLWRKLVVGGLILWQSNKQNIDVYFIMLL